MRTNQGLCLVCKGYADIVLTSPTGHRKYYCAVCYGDGKWLKEQGLFINWTISKSKEIKGKSKIFYLHTIDKEPAGYDGQQICYAIKNRRSWSAPLVRDLKTIKRQQKLTWKFRKKKFGEIKDISKYDYVVVRI